MRNYLQYIKNTRHFVILSGRSDTEKYRICLCLNSFLKENKKKQSHFMQLLVLLSGQATEISVWARQASEEHLIPNQGQSSLQQPTINII